MRFKPRKPTDYLKKNPQLRGLGMQLEQQQSLLSQVRRQLPNDLAGHCLAAQQQANRLLLFADSAAWASRLRFFSRNLLGRLSKLRPQPARVDVRVIPVSAPKPPPAGPRRPPLSRKSGQIIRETAESIDDPGLQMALLRLAEQAEKRR